MRADWEGSLGHGVRGLVCPAEELGLDLVSGGTSVFLSFFLNCGKIHIT